MKCILSSHKTTSFHHYHYFVCAYMCKWTFLVKITQSQANT